jgi:integrase
MTFSALARARLRALVADGGSDRTGDNYDEAYGLFVEYLHAQGMNDDVREFTFENVDGFKAWYGARPGVQKKSSVNNRLAALSSLGKWGMQHGDGKKGHRYLPANPVESVPRPKRQRPKEKFLYREELRALWAVKAQPNERLALEMFFDTGLRVSEVARARVRDLRPGQEGLVLTVLLKGGRLKEITIGPELSAKLEASLREREVGPDDPIFVNQAGTAYKKNTLTDVIYRLAKRAGITRIPVRPHVLRHTYNVLGDEAGLSPVVRAGLLNHDDTSTVMRYDHLRPRREAEARAKVREALRAEVAEQS